MKLSSVLATWRYIFWDPTKFTFVIPASFPLTSPSTFCRSTFQIKNDSVGRKMSENNANKWFMFSLEPNNFNMREHIYCISRKKKQNSLHPYRCLRMFIYRLMWRFVVPPCWWNRYVDGTYFLCCLLSPNVNILIYEVLLLRIAFLPKGDFVLFGLWFITLSFDFLLSGSR